MKKELSLAYQLIKSLDELLSHTDSGRILNEDAVHRAHIELEILRKDYYRLCLGAERKS